MRRDELVRWLDEYLKTAEQSKLHHDNSLNGLQVEGCDNVSKVGAAVDASLATFQKAAKERVDFLIVHHGLFWGDVFPITGHHKKRLGALLQNEMSLYCSHLPLDTHPEVGNNAQLAKLLKLYELKPFAAGFIGMLEAPASLNDLVKKMEVITGSKPLVHPNGPGTVMHVAVVSGAGAELASEAQRQGADVLITGEPKYAVYHQALEQEMNLIYAGHYLTETLGVKALAETIERQFGLPWIFLDHPTGI